MARRCFFSFHYVPDVTRAMIVRNSWLTKEREEAGFYDGSVFESKQRAGDDVLKRFLREGLDNTSVTCVLAGSETALRRWVRYELVQSFRKGNGMLGVQIHNIPDMRRQEWQGRTAAAGPNPLECLAYKVSNGMVSFYERRADGWNAYADAPGLSASEVPYAVNEGDYKTFGTLFSTYEWTSNNGSVNLGSWIEAAAKTAGR